MANAAPEFSLNAPIATSWMPLSAARTLLPIPETERLASTRELPPEKYNVKGLRVNSYITVGRRSDPKDRRDTPRVYVSRKSFVLVPNIRLV